MDYSGYEEVKAGEKQETTITEVKEGVQSDFRTDAYWEKVDNQEEVEEIKQQPALKVICENKAEMVVNLPVTKRISPRSKLAAFKLTYGDYPAEGMTVNTKSDESGFFRIVLEST